MPLPKVRSGENKTNFVSRCMIDNTMIREFPASKQRVAVCINLYDEATRGADAKESALRQELARQGVDLSRRRIKKPKPYKDPRKIEDTYRKQIFAMVRDIKANVKNYIIPLLPALVEDYTQTIASVGLDGYVEDLDTAMTTIRAVSDNSVNGKSFEEVAREIGADIESFSLEEHTKVLTSALGVAPVSSEPWIAAKESEFVKENAALIKELQESTLNDIEKIVRDGIRSGLRASEIEKEIIRKIGLDTLKPSTFKMSAANRARLIAVDQTLSYYSELNGLRQQNVGIDMYIWQTANDERVRGTPADDGGLYPRAKPSHFVMDGKLCRWDDPTVYSDDGGKTWKSRASIGGPLVHAGRPIRCRCYAEPYFKDLL